MPEPFPWQAEPWQRLTSLAAEDRLPHALLLAGPAQVGKLQFAEALCGYLLCKEPQGEGGQRHACGQCPGCHLTQAGTHPDLRRLGLEDSRQVRVEQVRDMIDWAGQSALRAGRKLAIIEPADAMNIAASNALLKCLEEPTPSTVLILVTSAPSRLLPTIHSRCQRVRLPLPERGLALDYVRAQREGGDAETLLDLAGGAPLRALDYDDAFLARRQALGQGLAAFAKAGASPLALAETLAKGDAKEGLEILYALVADAITCQHLEDKNAIKNKDLQKEVASLSAALKGEDLQALLARIATASAVAGGTANANPAMLYEWLLMSPERQGRISLRVD